MILSNNAKDTLEKLIISKLAKSIYELFEVYPDFSEERKQDILRILLGFVIFTQAKDDKEIKNLGSATSKESTELVTKVIAFINSELGK